MNPRQVLALVFAVLLIPPPHQLAAPWLPVLGANRSCALATESPIPCALVDECEDVRARTRAAMRGDTPRPRKGGDTITEEWLGSLDDRDARWRFR